MTSTTMPRATSSPMPETTALPSSPSHSLSGRRRVIPQRVAGLFANVAAFFVAAREFIRGEYQWVEGWWCAFCRDVHPDDEPCPRAMQAQCDICGIVTLDFYLCCPNGKPDSHHIVKSSIRPRNASHEEVVSFKEDQQPGTTN